MNSPLANLSAQQLRRAAALKDRIQSLEKELAKLLGATAPSTLPTPTSTRRKRKPLSKTARARMSAAQKERWAKSKAAKA